MFFALVTVFIIYPALTEISQVNTDITMEREKLERKLALGLNIKRIIQDLETIEEPAKRLDDIFIDRGKEIAFINDLELIASRHGIGMEISSDFIGSEIAVGITQVEIQMILTGNYIQILSFMSELESLNSYFNLKTVTFSKNKKVGNSSVIVQLVGNTYFKK